MALACCLWYSMVTPVPGLLAEAWGFCTAGSEDAYAANLLLFLGSLFVCRYWVREEEVGGERSEQRR